MILGWLALHKDHMKRYDFVPGLVASGAGLVDGAIETYVPATALGGFGEHVPTAFEALLIAGGLIGWGLDWNSDVAYTMQSSGMFGLSRRLVPALNHMVTGAYIGNTGRRRNMGFADVAAPAGCVGCGQAHGPARDIAPPAMDAAALMAPALPQVTDPVGGSYESATGIL